MDNSTKNVDKKESKWYYYQKKRNKIIMKEKMKIKSESNIIIAIDALKKIMTIFLGPFLTAYFIKTSNESMVDLSIYYIFSYLLLGVGTFIYVYIR